MAVYSAIAAGEIDDESPITTGVVSKYVRNPEAVYENANEYACYTADSAALTNDATLNSDASLLWTVSAGQVWYFEHWIYVTSTTNAHFRYKILTPSETATGHYSERVWQYRGTVAGSTCAITTRHTNTEVVITFIATSCVLMLAGWTFPSAAGSVTFQWAQGTSHGDSTILRQGSHFWAGCQNYI